MITSVRNPKIKLVRDLIAHPKDRRERQAFVVEGVRLVEESLESGWEAQLVLYDEGLSPRGLETVQKFAECGATIEAISSQVMETISDTEAPQGILAVIRMRTLPLPPTPDFILILDGIRDPGNLGTILRTAAAAQVQAVLLTAGTADPFAPKVVRAAMGANFRMPVLNLSWQEIRLFLKPPEDRTLTKVYLADSSGGMPHTQADFKSPLSLIIGGEAGGAGMEAQSLADNRVHVSMPGQVESLNAAIAAAILMFEVVRQRSKLT